MTTKSISLLVSPEIGRVTAEYFVPEDPHSIITLAHGAGAGMNHIFMRHLATSLGDAGIATLRFNFPFTEQGKKRVDTPAVAHKTIEAAIAHAGKSFRSLPLFVSGKSFGGRMSSQFLAIQSSPAVKGIVFYGFPLHPAGKPSIERAEHLSNVTLPMLFLQGTRDELATMQLIEDVTTSLPLATLVKIEGADHSFKAGKQNTVEVLVNETVEWMRKLG
jgi:predicted alpha/beta-hydrolase family hydrolase